LSVDVWRMPRQAQGELQRSARDLDLVSLHRVPADLRSVEWVLENHALITVGPLRDASTRLKETVHMPIPGERIEEAANVLLRFSQEARVLVPVPWRPLEPARRGVFVVVLVYGNLSRVASVERPHHCLLAEFLQAVLGFALVNTLCSEM